MITNITRVAIACVGTVCVSIHVHSGQVEFIPLGDLPGGIFESKAVGISGDGSIVIGLGNSDARFNGTHHGFRWTRETGMVPMEDFDDDGVTFGGGLGISQNGDWIAGGGGTWRENRGIIAQYAGLWHPDGTKTIIGEFPGGEKFGAALAISNDGRVAVGESIGEKGYTEAFRWTPETGMQRLDGWANGGIPMFAADVSADGQWICGWGDPKVNGVSFESFRYSEEHGIEPLGFYQDKARNQAQAMSDDGKVVVGNTFYKTGRQDGTMPFVWTEEEGIIGLGGIGGLRSLNGTAHDVSADGRFVVGYSHVRDWAQAFIWDADNGMRSVQDILEENLGEEALEGWTLDAAFGVSDDGQWICGRGWYWVDGSTVFEGWVARIPEPATLVLIGLLVPWLRKR